MPKVELNGEAADAVTIANLLEIRDLLYSDIAQSVKKIDRKHERQNLENAMLTLSATELLLQYLGHYE